MKKCAKQSVLLTAFCHAGMAFAFNAPASYTALRSLDVNSAAYNAQTGTILATIPSKAGPILGNTVTTLDQSGRVLHSAFIGSEPDSIAISADGKTAYVAMTGANLLREYDVSAQQASTQFVVPGGWTVRNLTASPTQSGTYYALNYGFLSNGKQLEFVESHEARSGGLWGSLAFGPNNTLYAYDNATSEFALYTYQFTDSEYHVISSTTAAFAGFFKQISYDDGLLYSSSGEVYDPLSNQKQASFQSPTEHQLNGFLSDSAQGVAYGIDTSGNLTIFDRASRQSLSTYSLRFAFDYIESMFKMQNGNLGVVGRFTPGADNSLVIIQAIPEPSTALLFGLGGTALIALSRRKKVH